MYQANHTFFEHARMLSDNENFGNSNQNIFIKVEDLAFSSGKSLV